MEKANGVIIISVMSLRFKNQEREKIWVRAVDNISSIELKGLPSDNNLIMRKGWTMR
jgi:hypothetical protein